MYLVNCHRNYKVISLNMCISNLKKLGAKEIFFLGALNMLNIQASVASEGSFVLSDNTALMQVQRTQYVQDLILKYPNVLMRVEESDAKFRILYLGFDEGTHTTRYQTLKVDKNGVVYRNEDITQVNEVWVPLK